MPTREVGAEEWEAIKAFGRAEGRERVRRKWRDVGTGREPFKVVHISDVHVDRNYVVRLSSSLPPSALKESKTSFLTLGLP